MYLILLEGLFIGKQKKTKKRKKKENRRRNHEMKTPWYDGSSVTQDIKSHNWLLLSKVYLYLSF